MTAKTGIAHKAGWLALMAAATLLLLSGTAVAQLSLQGNLPVPGTGIPFGATGLTSPGLSPAPAGTIGPTGTGTTCSAVGGSSPVMSGTYDGGGIGMGAPALASSVMCDPTSTSAAPSMAMPTSPMTPGAVSPAGIPLGSFEINNLGISPSVSVPTPTLTMPATMSPLPSTMGVLPPTMGASMLPAPTIGTGMPCPTTGSYLPSTTGC